MANLLTRIADAFRRAPSPPERVEPVIEARRTEPQDTELRHALAFPFRAESQVAVTEEAVMGEATAMACATLNARSMAMLPAHVMAPLGQDAADGNQRLTGHSVEALLSSSPNPEMTAFQFKEALMLAAQFHGAGYAEIERDGVGRPIALWPLHPYRVDPDRDDAGRKVFQVDNRSAGRVTIPDEDMFVLAGPSLDGQSGMSVISYGRHTLGLAIAQDRFASNFIANQAAPSGLLKIGKAGASTDGMARIRSEANKLYAGPRKAGRIMFGDSDWSWEAIGMTPTDAEFLAQRRFSVEQVCRFFGVPPQKIGDTNKQTFANFEQANLAYLTDGLLPWLVRFEQEANRKLLRAVAGRARPFLKINASAIVRADLEKRYRAYAVGRQWGWFSVNDVRRLEDMEPIGPEGDVYLTPLNMGPLDGEQPPTQDELGVARQARRLAGGR